MLDPNTEFGAHALRRLNDEHIIWLTTVRADGTPQPSPVWFLWNGSSALLYSQPDTPKVRNIAQNPQVALNFDGNGRGGDIVVFTGTAAVDSSAPRADKIPAYIEKYTQGLKGIQMTPEQFAEVYSTAIRVELTKVRGHSD